jgi:hypothetical protein
LINQLKHLAYNRLIINKVKVSYPPFPVAGAPPGTVVVGVVVTLVVVGDVDGVAVWANAIVPADMIDNAKTPAAIAAFCIIFSPPLIINFSFFIA